MSSKNKGLSTVANPSLIDYTHRIFPETMEVLPEEPNLDEDIAFQSTDLEEDKVAEPIVAEHAPIVLNDEAPAVSPPTLNPYMVYKILYRHHATGEILHTRENSEPIVYQNTPGSSRVPIFEHITDVYTTATFDGGSNELIDPYSDVMNACNPCLKINSPAIINALQSVVDYYPGQDFSGNYIILNAPFSVLIHYEKELSTFRDQYAPGSPRSEKKMCEREENTYEHLGALQSFLQRLHGAAIESERLRYKRGYATFGTLWLLLRPGVTVYGDTYLDGNYDAFIVQSVTGGPFNGRPKPWNIELWFLDYDGEKVGKRSEALVIQPFNEEREISTLNVFPCEFWKASKKEDAIKDLGKHLVERGKKFFKLTSRCCMSYDGFTDSFPKYHYKGFVIVDMETYYKVESSGSAPVLGEISDGVPSGVSQCLCPVCLKYSNGLSNRKQSVFNDYKEIYPEKTDKLTEHQYLICSNSVTAYLTEARRWKSLYVADISDPVFDKGMIDTLVMADERRQMLKALANNYARKDSSDQTSRYRPWKADFVDAKGEGKIFLLHGKPGVGKTYTAECIAHYTRRPLLSLTISDIGTDPEEAEENLITHFTRAKLWDAILLVDEADIYMESREKQDLKRNSLVSGFLRALEQCESILFLTTNRIGSFDDAFISRIHVTLYYPDFTETERKKVWKNFFDKLIRDRGDIMRVPIDTKDYINGKEVRAVKWNGREIRNAIQTAVALADFEGATDEDGKILLKEIHIQQIVRMSSDFRNYLDTLHQGDESKRAERQRIRYDPYTDQNEDSDKEQRRK